MSDHTPSGQQAVAPVLSAAETADRLEAWAREMLAATPPKTGALHLLDAVHYLRTVTPTAPSTAAGEDRGEVVREAIASVFDKGSDEIIALRDASSFHSVSHDALTTYASNLAGWAQQIRDMPLPPPSPPWQE